MSRTIQKDLSVAMIKVECMLKRLSRHTEQHLKKHDLKMCCARFQIIISVMIIHLLGVDHVFFIIPSYAGGGGGGGQGRRTLFSLKFRNEGYYLFFSYAFFFGGGRGFNFKGVYARENDEKMDDPLRNRMNTKQYANLNQIHMAKSVSISGRTHFTSFSRIGLLKTTKHGASATIYIQTQGHEEATWSKQYINIWRKLATQRKIY